MLSSFSTRFLTMKNEIELCSKVCDREQFTITVRSVACAIIIFFHIVLLCADTRASTEWDERTNERTLFSPFKKFKKNMCCEEYSKACLREIWLWSLSNITSKKYFEKFKNFFSYNFFQKFVFFCGIALLVSTTYIFFIKIGQAVFKKNHFLNFAFLLHNSQKMNF